MGMKLAIERITALAALAWAAEIAPGGGALHVVFGVAVEADEGGIVEPDPFKCRMAR
jgi:hypothetical protein